MNSFKKMNKDSSNSETELFFKLFQYQLDQFGNKR